MPIKPSLPLRLNLDGRKCLRRRPAAHSPSPHATARAVHGRPGNTIPAGRREMNRVTAAAVAAATAAAALALVGAHPRTASGPGHTPALPPARPPPAPPRLPHPPAAPPPIP